VRDNNWKRSLRFGVEKIPWVNWQLATPAEKHRAALRACKVLGTNAVSLAPLILEHFNHWEAVEALVNMRAAAVPTLVGSLASTSDGVRFAATAALAMIGPDAVDAVPDLANLLSKDTSNVRILAAAALGLIGRNPAVAVPALREALAVPAIDVQRTAAMALATFGAAAKSAIPDLIKAKQSQDIVVRSNAMHALKAIDPQSFGDYE
jgi:HEAT repeat protein